ncbi:MAG: lytic murein transglycosylase B, partial [Gammaproteobacteria bacterium]|nr:lytic murein transglycosylase B [Gammaproteobacteria bacterium]
AGAMGMPQFISSSFRRYAVDFNDDGQRDIWTSIDDVIGSVANYLAVHGWKAGEAITAPAAVSGDAWASVVEQGLKPAYTLAELRGLGVTPARETRYQGRSSLVELEQPGGVEHWLAFQNFYTITRYNHSALYAMAVTQLAERIRESYANATRAAP